VELEKALRKLAKDRDELIVITGPAYEEPIKTIGRNSVGVPTHFFKIILDPVEPSEAAFLMPHRNDLRSDALGDYKTD
jgi:endonuclease G